MNLTARIAATFNRSGAARGNVVGAAAMPAVTRGSQGSGAPSSRRAPIALLVALALAIAAFTAAPASAAPPVPKMGSISEIKGGSAHLTGEASATGGAIAYFFQYCTVECSEASAIWTSGPEGVVEGSEYKPVQENLEGLKADTKYFVRLLASAGFLGQSTSEKPYPSFTTLSVAPPSVTVIDNASEVAYTTATATGKVERPAPIGSDPADDTGIDVNCHFEYITDAQFLANVGSSEPGFTGATAVDCEPNPVKAAGESAVTAHLEGLANNTTYHLRLTATNAGGTDAKEAASTFTTLKVDPPSVVSIEDAGEVKYNQAQVKGVVERPTTSADPAFDVNCSFEYIADADYQANPPAERFAGAGAAGCLENPITAASADVNGEQAVSAELAGLRSGTTYHLRLSATNLGGSESKEAASTFTTQTVTPPVLALDAPGAIGYATAHISGTVDPEGGTVDPTTSEPFPINWQLQFARADEPGNWQFGEAGTIAGAEAASTDPITVAKVLEGLQIGTEYKFRLLATYDDQEATSTEGSFTTEPVNKPIVSLDPVTDPTDTTAKFTGTVSANAPGPVNAEGEALYKTDWEITCQPGCPNLSGGSPGTVQAVDGAKAFSVEAADLEPNTAYEVTLKASNAAGSQDVVRTFHTTLILPGVTSAPGASDGEGGYFLQGIVNPHNSPVTDCHFVYGPNSELDPKKYPFAVPCSPTPKGRNEVQRIQVIGSFSSSGAVAPADSGQFRLSFRGETTVDLPFDATPAEVGAALTALSTIGPADITVSGRPGLFEVTFEGSLAEIRLPLIRGENGTIPLGYCEPCYGFGGTPRVEGSTLVQGGNNFPITVEGHVTGLTPGATYHSRLVVTNGVGTSVTDDQPFKPTLNPPSSCENEQLRKENNSLALPECRAYEKVTPSGKEGTPAELSDYAPDTVLYDSFAGNLAGSGNAGAIQTSLYVSRRTATGWETIPNLNGPNGSMMSPPDNASATGVYPHYSADFLTSLWTFSRKGEPADRELWLRNPDASLASVGQGMGSFAGASDDLSHIVYAGISTWGPGVYEFVGTGNEDPRRVDLDNSGTPISTCEPAATAGGRNTVSTDGRVIFVTAAGSTGTASCTGTASPPADEVWARIGGVVSVDASASECNRTAPAEPCNAPSNATFLAATPDGSRVFFSTRQQLVDGDTDQTSDIYECDIPLGTPTPTGKANPCTALRQVSGAATGADVERAFSISEDGSTVYFTSKGVLADNEDALGNAAQPGDSNLYVWRIDAAHPDGQTSFVARLTDSGSGPNGEKPETTPDGRYLIFLTRTPLLPTDTDESLDLYRYDADSGLLSRVSTRLTGVGGNGDFDVKISNPFSLAVGESGHHPNTAISDDGQKVVFSTAEPLSPIDGNNAADVYLWTPAGVSLITTGSVGGGEVDNGQFATSLQGSGVISSSGRDIFFGTAGQLVASDGDRSGDVYDARVDGGFPNPPPGCSGESCQPPAPAPPSLRNPGSTQAGPGNPIKSKPCPKGKVRKHGKCVKKPSKKHSGKKHHSKKASHKQGGGK